MIRCGKAPKGLGILPAFQPNASKLRGGAAFFVAGASMSELRKGVKMGNMDVAGVVECENPHHVTRGFNSQKAFPRGEEDLSEHESEVLDGPRAVVGMHWLRGSLLETKMTWLVEKMCVLFGSEYEKCEYGLLPRYDRHYRWPCGASVNYHSTLAGWDSTAGRFAVEIPGKALESLDTWYIGSFCVALDNHDFQASRIDLYFDDHRRLITPSRLYQTVYEEGLFEDMPIKMDFSHFKVITNKSRSKRGVGKIHDEITFGLRGSKGGGKFMRFYDKALESNGENNACRWELELSRGKARAAFEKIVEAWKKTDGDKRELVNVIGEIIGGSIDFLRRTDRAGDKNLSRLSRYHFWSVVLEQIGKAKLAVKLVVKTIESAREWVGHQVTGVLQMLTTAIGRAEFLGSLVEKCVETDRIKPHHQKLIDAYRDQIVRGVGPGRLPAGFVR